MDAGKVKRRGKSFLYVSRQCLSCHRIFRARARRLQGKVRLIRRICKKCRVDSREIHYEEPGG